MFPTTREFVLFLLLVVGLPFLIAAGLPAVAWKLRAGHPMALAVLLLVQSVVAAGLSWFAAGQTRWLPLIAAGFLLSTLITFGLSVGRAPLPTVIVSAVVLVLGGVATVRARLEEMEETAREHAQSDALLAQLDRCRDQFSSAVAPKDPLPDGWASTFETTFDGVSYSLKGPFEAEVTLTCLGGLPGVMVKLDGPEDDVEARARDVAALPIDKPWVARASEKVRNKTIELAKLPTVPELRRTYFAMPLEPSDGAPK